MRLSKSYGRPPAKHTVLDLRAGRPFIDTNANKVRTFVRGERVTVVGVKATYENLERAWPAILKGPPPSDQNAQDSVIHDSVWVYGEGTTEKVYICPTCVWFPWADRSTPEPKTFNVRGWKSSEDFKRRHCRTSRHAMNFEILWGLTRGIIDRAPYKCQCCGSCFTREDSCNHHRKHCKHSSSESVQLNNISEGSSPVSVQSEVVDNAATNQLLLAGSAAVEMLVATYFDGFVADDDQNIVFYESSWLRPNVSDNVGDWLDHIDAGRENDDVNNPWVFGYRDQYNSEFQ